MATSRLGRCNELRSETVNRTSTQLQHFAHALEALPTQGIIKSEASRLIDRIFAGNGPSPAKKSTYSSANKILTHKYLLDICTRLENPEVEIADLLKEDLPAEPALLLTPPDLIREIEKAWQLDQAQILHTKGKILENVCNNHCSLA